MSHVETPAAPHPAASRRWRFRFGLRALLFAVAAASVAFAMIAQRAWEQKRFIEQIEKLGGRAYLDWQVAEDGQPLVEPSAPESWLREKLGSHFVDDVVGLDLTDLSVFDETFDNIAKHRKMRFLILNGTATTDARLGKLARLRSLERLDLTETHVTDKGLEHLRNFPLLKTLKLAFSKVESPDLAYLEDLPNLESLQIDATACSPEAQSRIEHAHSLQELQFIDAWYHSGPDAKPWQQLALPRITVSIEKKIRRENRIHIMWLDVPEGVWRPLAEISTDATAEELWGQAAMLHYFGLNESHRAEIDALFHEAILRASDPAPIWLAWSDTRPGPIAAELAARQALPLLAQHDDGDLLRLALGARNPAAACCAAVLAGDPHDPAAWIRLLIAVPLRLQIDVANAWSKRDPNNALPCLVDLWKRDGRYQFGDPRNDNFLDHDFAIRGAQRSRATSHGTIWPPVAALSRAKNLAAAALASKNDAWRPEIERKYILEQSYLDQYHASASVVFQRALEQHKWSHLAPSSLQRNNRSFPPHATLPELALGASRLIGAEPADWSTTAAGIWTLQRLFDYEMVTSNPPIAALWQPIFQQNDVLEKRIEARRRRHFEAHAPTTVFDVPAYWASLDEALREEIAAARTQLLADIAVAIEKTVEFAEGAP